MTFQRRELSAWVGLLLALVVAVTSGALAANRGTAAARSFVSGTAATLVSARSGFSGGELPLPALAQGPAGRELTVYTGGNEAVLARPLDNNGLPIGPQVVVFAGPAVDNGLKVLWVPWTHRYLLAWSSSGVIEDRAVSADGTVVGPVQQAASNR